MKRFKTFFYMLLALVALGSIVAAMVQHDRDLQRADIKKEAPNTKVLNKIEELRLNYDMYIADENFLKRATAVGLYNNLSERMNKGGFVVVLYKVGKDEKRKFIGAWLKSLTKAGYKMSVISINKANKDKNSIKIDERVFTADIVALSVRPFGMYAIEKTNDPVSDLTLIAQTFNEERVKSLSTNIENFEFIGYIGWKSETVDEVGKEAVKVDYYTAKTTVGGKTYRFFLAIPQHSAIGYNGYSPKKFTSITDWNTDIWEGQVLHDWGPKNEGSNTQITFTLTAGVQGEEPIATATISYSVQGGLEIR